MSNQPEQHYCPTCGQPIRQWKQPGYLDIVPDRWYGECLYFNCPLEGVTLLLGDHEKLSPQQIAQYARSKPEHWRDPVHP